MDERLWSRQIGKPIPEWDRKHRLPTDRYVGPVCRDSGTVFRITDRFIEITDQPHLERHMLALMFSLASLFVGAGIFYIYAALTKMAANTMQTRVEVLSIGVICCCLFGYFVVRSGRDEVFSLTRRPIRLDRRDRKIYALRKRRFLSRKGRPDGDVVWEIPWGRSTHFCINRSADSYGAAYQIRCYELDENNNVLRAFSLGREWILEELPLLLAEWNYLCWYMNNGTRRLPLPLLFLSERESMLDSFLTCFFQMGLNASPAFRIVTMPIILLLTVCRIVSLMTCRDPIWPSHLKAKCEMESDGFNEPSDKTPVGWAATMRAHKAGTYPNSPMTTIEGWTGPDEETNAAEWAADKPSRVFADAA
jgi:hypothetical protein